ncbi:hypothetical protein Tco_0479126 [Tanacetum coccineum]
MLCYLTRMEPYYIQCIKDGPFLPKTVEGATKPESQLTNDERRVVNQDQHLKSIIISCLPYDIMESVISCETTKATWTDLVHSFEGPSDTKENRIMDLKLNLPEKRLSLSEGLRNANHTHTLDLADIFGRFDFQENSDNEADERSSKEYLRDLELEFHDYKDEYKKMKAKLALLEKEVSDDEEMTQVKVLMALADDELAVGKNHARNGEWIDITMRKVNILLSMDEDSNWQTYLKYINIDLKFVKEHRLNMLSKYNKIIFELNKCIDDLLVFKQEKLDAVTFQIQNTELTKLNHALQEQLKKERKVNEHWLNSSNKVSQCISEQIPNKMKKVLRIEQLTESSSKNDVKQNPFILASLDYDHEMILKSKDWVKRHNPNSKLPNFNTGRILVPESQAVNECLKLTEAPTHLLPKSQNQNL